MRRLILLVTLAALSASSVTVTTIADITGDGAAHPIFATTTAASWIQFVAPSGNASNIRLGDSSVSTSRGIPIPPGGGMYYPKLPHTNPTVDVRYDMSKLYYLIQSGDTLSITYAP